MKRAIAVALLVSVWLGGCSSREDKSVTTTDTGATTTDTSTTGTDSGTDSGTGGDGTTTGDGASVVPVGQIRVVGDSATLLTGGSRSVLITALVTDSANRALTERTVTFSSQQGVLQNVRGTTDEAGSATVELNLAGDLRNQNIEIFAESDDVSGSTTVAAFGSGMTLEGASEIVSGEQGEIVVTLLAGDGTGIPNEWVNISSQAGNQISFASQVTDPNGQISLMVGSDAGDDVISFTALEQTVSAQHQLSVVESVQSVSTPIKIRVISNASVIETGGSDTATITALVTDEDNRVIEGHQVEFSSTGGVLQNIVSSTSAAGQATAELNLAGDYRNQVITVTADSGGQIGSVQIGASGSNVSVAGPTALVGGNTADLTITLTSGNGQPISNHVLQVSSQAGNAISPSTVVTDSSGKAVITVGSTEGDDTIVVSALEGTATFEHGINVADDILTVNTPVVGDELIVGEDTPVEILWTSNGVPVSGRDLNLSITAGELSDTTVTTNGSGIATLTVTSVSSGPATIAIEDAADADPATQVDVEFVATDVNSVSTSAAPASVGTGSESVISAVVTDSAGNPVKGVVVTFFSDDLKGGNLSPVAALTDGDGRARVTFTAGAQPSEVDEIVISARAIDDDSDVVDSVDMTITERQLNVIVGLAGSIVEADADTRYIRSGVVQVTDGSGTPVPDATIAVTAVPVWYALGEFVRVDTDDNNVADQWDLLEINIHRCRAEDLNGNRVLDTGEDDNGNGELDPQDPALIQADNGNTPTVVGGSITTDANGVGFFSLAYPQSHAGWSMVEITARAQALGAESTAVIEQDLAWAASDVQNVDVSPPNQYSPHGTLAPGQIVNCVEYEEY